MIIRRSSDRGTGNFGWLQATYTFSFSRFYDPKWVGFGPLLVINQDKVAPSNGFNPHSHNDMEILTYIIEGSLQHKDNFGHVAIIKPGDAQLMSAGSGITHSEMNIDPEKGVHLLQIWIEPNTKKTKPSYQQKDFSKEIDQGLTLLASPDQELGSLKINQDAKVYAGKLPAGSEFKVKSGWVQVITGKLTSEKGNLFAGDGAGLSEGNTFNVQDNTHLLYFEFKP